MRSEYRIWNEIASLLHSVSFEEMSRIFSCFLAIQFFFELFDERKRNFSFKTVTHGPQPPTTNKTHTHKIAEQFATIHQIEWIKSFGIKEITVIWQSFIRSEREDEFFFHPIYIFTCVSSLSRWNATEMINRKREKMHDKACTEMKKKNPNGMS